MTTKQPLQPDFPAAHRMDTAWVAVDRDGHVGMIRWWEPGAVPEVIAQQNDEISLDPAPSRMTRSRWTWPRTEVDLSDVFTSACAAHRRFGRLRASAWKRSAASPSFGRARRPGGRRTGCRTGVVKP